MILAGSWVARAVVDGTEYVVRGAMTRWGAKRALRRMVRRDRRQPIVEDFRV